ncbi:MAG: TonB family protein [Acidobacteriota bacterium]
MPKSEFARIGILLIAFSLVVSWTSVAGAQQVPFFVIVHPDNNVEMLSRQAISDIFLKKTTQWGDDLVAEPVDLDSESGIRRFFSLEIHDLSTADVKKFWQEKIDSGYQGPPLEVATEDDAIAFVRQHPGAIAYVSTSASFEGVKIVPLVVPPVVIKKVSPNYSERAFRFRIEGEVVLRLQVNEEGRVKDVTVLKGLEYGLTEEAIRSVKRWRFEPATTGGIPVSADIDVTINFSL